MFTKVTQDQKEYKLVNKGPKLSEEHVQRFLKKFQSYVKGIICAYQEVYHKGFRQVF